MVLEGFSISTRSVSSGSAPLDLRPRSARVVPVLAGAGAYGATEEHRAQLAERVEELISIRRTGWASTRSRRSRTQLGTDLGPGPVSEQRPLADRPQIRFSGILI